VTLKSNIFEMKDDEMKSFEDDWCPVAGDLVEFADGSVTCPCRVKSANRYAKTVTVFIPAAEVDLDGDMVFNTRTVDKTALKVVSARR
jgi:hypothetical protein